MNRISKFINLSASQQRRVINTGLLLLAFRLGLWLVPYRILRRFAECPRNDRKTPTDQKLGEIIRNIVSIAQFIPEASCLTQALTAQVLLRREGFDPSLQLGVARDPGGAFKAHAWVECDGRIVVGDFSATLPYSTLRAANATANTSSAAAAGATHNG